MSSIQETKIFQSLLQVSKRIPLMVSGKMTGSMWFNQEEDDQKAYKIPVFVHSKQYVPEKVSNKSNIYEFLKHLYSIVELYSHLMAMVLVIFCAVIKYLTRNSVRKNLL